jgi:hypothetical protein
MSSVLEFPLQLQRQYAGPLDKDSVFSTTVERMAYLTNGRRYAGQPVVDLEEGSFYILNAAKNEYIPVGTGNGRADEESLTYQDMLLLDTAKLRDGHKIFVWDASGDTSNKVEGWGFYRYDKDVDSFTLLSKGNVSVDLSNYYTKTEVDSLLKTVGGKGILAPVEDLVGLKALDTTDPLYYPDKWVIYVSSVNTLYALYRASTSAEDGEYVIAPTTGTGRWIKVTEAAFRKNTAFNKNFGTGAGTVAEGNHTHSGHDIVFSFIIQEGGVVDYKTKLQERATVAGTVEEININTLTNLDLSYPVRLEIDSKNAGDILAGLLSVKGDTTATINGVAGAAVTVLQAGGSFTGGVINDINIRCVKTNPYKLIVDIKNL